MNIDKVVNFPFPSPPSSEALEVRVCLCAYKYLHVPYFYAIMLVTKCFLVIAEQAAERLLIKLGAVSLPNSSRLAAATSHVPASVITPLGKTMAHFPVAPRYGKMLMLGRQHGCLPYVIAMVAAVSVREIFVETSMNVSPFLTVSVVISLSFFHFFLSCSINVFCCVVGISCTSPIKG